MGRSARTPAAAVAAAAAERDPPPPLQRYPPPPAEPEQQWRKVLYAPQPHGDSHTDGSFLEALVVNATVPQRDYRAVVWSTLVVDQQLSTVAAVGSASFHLYQGSITARQLLLVDVLLMLAGAVLYLASSAWAAAVSAAGTSRSQRAKAAAGASPMASPGKQGQLAAGSASPIKQHQQQQQQQLQQQKQSLGWRGALDGLGSMAALAAGTALLSPLLGTLTETVSSDSIIACACLLLLAHLYLHDYHFTAGLAAHLSGSLALGCAVCGSVLIASRLGSPEAVYAQLLLSLELYILGPYCRRQVAAAAPPAAHAALTAALAGGAAALLARQSVLLTSAFCCALLFVTLICPMWLVRIHKFKAQINGPWDEAAPNLFRHLPRQQ